MMLSKKITQKIVILLVIIVFGFQPLLAFGEEINEIPTDIQTTQSGENQGDVSIGTGDVDIDVGVTNDVNQNQVEDNSDNTSENVVDENSLLEEGGESQENSNFSEEKNESINSEKDLGGELQIEQGSEENGSEYNLTPAPDAETPTSTDDGYENKNEAITNNLLEAGGISGENSTEETGGTSTITSGDIDIKSNLENDVNKNDLDLACLECDEQGSSSPVLNIENNNNANTSNGVNLSATSGDNIIENSGDAYIESGNISIISIIVNFINTNLIGNGKEFFINIFNKTKGDIDISGYGEGPAESNNYGECDGPDCQLNVKNNSTSTLNNLVNIKADTGSNLIATTSGGGYIETGDIDIVNDILNIANLNISGNDWFFAVVNIFGSMDGDIILPAFKQSSINDSATSAEESFVKPEISSEFIISNKNNGNLENDMNINASTGNNDVAGAGEANIITGDIQSDSKIFNLVNYNIAGDFWKFARINVFGSWEGIINGLPPEYSYYADENGITIYNKFLDDLKLNESYAQLAVENYNIASTTNDIIIDANTGDNSILHQEEYGLIKTGYIKIKNSLMNFLNSNFTGNNWEFSMINVFGDWKGNLDFGQPELWINVSSSEVGTAEEGDLITYTFIYGNNGDSTATDVVVFDDFNEGALEIAENGGGEVDGKLIAWSLGNIRPNSQGSFSYTTQVKKLAPGKHTIKNNSKILSNEADRDETNNIASVSFLANGGAPLSGIRAVSTTKTSLPSLSIVKTNSANDLVYPGDIIDYKLVIRNNGSKDALEVYVLDVMTNIDTGEEIHRDFWNLETVLAGEEIIIEYSLEISSSIKSGVYINEATIEGYDPNRQMYISAIGSSRNKIINDLEKEENLRPNLNLSKIYRSNYANPGDIINFEIIIANNGRGDAFNVELSETLPEYLSYTENNENSKSWNFDVLKIGEIINIKYTASVSGDAKSGSYSGHLNLLGDNIESSSLNNTFEIRIPAVLGESFVQAEVMGGISEIIERDKSAKISLTNIENSDEMITNTEEDSLAQNDQASGVLGASSGDDGNFSFYILYLLIVLLSVILTFLLLWLVSEKEEDSEKLF